MKETKTLYANKNPRVLHTTTLPKSLLLRVKRNCSIFFETGTNNGAGVALALDCGFSRVISVEIVESLFETCRKRFLDKENVSIILGDSRDAIKNNAPTGDERILFWLDGHELNSIPLIEELEQIKSLSRNDHIILIDDVRMFGTPQWGHFSIEPIKELLMEIIPNYKISFANSAWEPNDILVACP